MLDSEPDTDGFLQRCRGQITVSAEARTNKDGSFQLKLRLKGPTRPMQPRAKWWSLRRLKYCNNIGDAKAGADLHHDASLCSRVRGFFWDLEERCAFFVRRVLKRLAPSGVQAHKRSIHFSWETVLFSVIGYYNHPAWKAAYDSSFPNPVPPFLWPERSHSLGTRNSRSKHFFSLRVEI